MTIAEGLLYQVRPSALIIAGGSLAVATAYHNQPVCSAPKNCPGPVCAVQAAAATHMPVTLYTSRALLQVNAAQQHLQQSLPDDDSELSEDQEAALVGRRL